MTSQRNSVKYSIFDGTTTGITNSVSKAFFSDDFINITYEVTAIGGSVDLYLKFPGSDFSNNEVTTLADAYPNFSAAVSATNPWSYMQFIDLKTGTAYTGSTGINITTAGTYKFMLNTNQIRWTGVEISSRNSGGVKVTLNMSDNR